MKTVTIIIVLLVLSLSAFTQPFSKKYFKNTEWFSYDIDSSLNVSDTIKFIKYSNFVEKFGNYNEYAEDEYSLLKKFPYTRISFYRNKNMDLWTVTDGWVTKSKEKDRLWKFSNEQSTLEIYYKRKLEYKLIPISIKIIKIKSNYLKYPSPLETEELTLIKMNK